MTITNQRWSHARLSMGRALRKCMEAVTHEKQTPKAPKKPGSPNVLLTDEQVIEARTLHERDGMKRAELAARFGVSVKYMGDLLSYQTRSKLYPPIR